jgi:hypothetical protein
MYEPFERFRNPRNMKSLDWYYNNSVLLTPDNWRDLKKNDILIFVYTDDEEGTSNLKEIMESWLETDYIELSVFTNFEPINKNTKTYAYDIHDAKVNPYGQVIIKDKRMRHDGYSMFDDIKRQKGFYLIRPQFTKDFLNYSQLPNTK